MTSRQRLPRAQGGWPSRPHPWHARRWAIWRGLPCWAPYSGGPGGHPPGAAERPVLQAIARQSLDEFLSRDIGPSFGFGGVGSRAPPRLPGPRVASVARVSCRSDLTADQGLEDLESTCAVQGSAYRAVAAQSLKDILLVEGYEGAFDSLLRADVGPRPLERLFLGLRWL